MDHVLEMRKYFVKETKAPIPTLQSPFFEYYLHLYENRLGLETKYNEFLTKFSNMDYRNKFYTTLDTLIADMKHGNLIYQGFITADMSSYDNPYTPLHSCKKLYKSTNAHKKFISLDFITANFYACKQYDSNFFGPATTYSEWLIVAHPDGKHFSESKNFRQILFGNLNTKRQQKIERYYLGLLLEKIHTRYNLDELEVTILSADECIFPYSEQLERAIDDVLSEWEADATLAFKIRKEIFTLNPTILSSAYVRSMDNGEDKFFCAPKHQFAQVYKRYYGLEIDMNHDLVFEHEGILVRYMEPLPLDES